MIPRVHITAWRNVAPWPQDAQVEQDLVLSRALVDLFSQPSLRESFAVRGGTILHKHYLGASRLRYSQDIDLVRLETGPVGPTIEVIRKALRWLGRPRYSLREHTARFAYRFQSEVPPVVPLRLKLEAKMQERPALLGLTEVSFRVENPWFAGEAQVPTYRLEELLGTKKMRALYQRKKGRDLFDLWIALETLDLDLEGIAASFRYYMEPFGGKVTVDEFEANLDLKLKDSAFLSDVVPLLATGVTFDASAAGRVLKERILPLLAGDFR